MSPAIKEPGRSIPTSGILTLAEAADYLRTSEDLLQKMATSGAVPARKIGEEWRFLQSALDAWLAHDSSGSATSVRWIPLLSELDLEQVLSELERRILNALNRQEPVPSKEAAKQRLLELAGSWKDDPTAEQMLQEIYRRRGRPITEDGE